MKESAALSSQEKTYVAMAAAMGGGCRTCAERLFAIAQSLEMGLEEIDRAFFEGLVVRDVATQLMREKVHFLRHPEAEPEDTLVGSRGGRIRELSRLAAAVAANAGPAGLGYAKLARSAGASETAVAVAIGIGRSIRAKAQSFSDQEFGESGTVEEGCGTSATASTEIADVHGGDACGCEKPPSEAPSACCG
jgi:hypothetical protein